MFALSVKLIRLMSLGFAACAVNNIEKEQLERKDRKSIHSAKATNEIDI